MKSVSYLSTVLPLICITWLAASSCSKTVAPNSSAKQDYLPTLAGYHWSYVGDLAEKKKITGNTRTFHGRIYAEGETEYHGKTTTGYVLKENGNYYSRGFLGTAGDTIELTILKDNVPPGTSWYDTLATSMIPIAYKFTIDEKNFSYTVSNKTYEKVIKVKMQVSFVLPQSTRLIATEYLFFAPAVGIIQLQTISSKGSVSNSYLDSYGVK